MCVEMREVDVGDRGLRLNDNTRLGGESGRVAYLRRDARIRVSEIALRDGAEKAKARGRRCERKDTCAGKVDAIK